MAHCTNCGSDHAIQNAIEIAVAPNGAPTVLRCKLCGSTERHREPERCGHIRHDVPVPSESIGIEEARARTAVLQAEMSRLM